jgi:hypothetical protein
MPSRWTARIDSVESSSQRLVRLVHHASQDARVSTPSVGGSVRSEIHTPPVMDLRGLIFEWSQRQPAWRRDLMRRLCEAPALAPHDEEEALTLLIASHGGSSGGATPQPLALDDLPHSTDTPRLELARVGRLVNVNRLAADQELIFGPALNVIYGGTRTGKTGYARVLKRSCRAVDEEPLLGDVYSNDSRSPQALIAVRTECEEQALQIDLTEPGPTILTKISVFDGRCASVYATQETVAFTPTELRLFDRLAQAQLALRERVDSRLLELRHRRPNFADIESGTEARQLVESLSSGSAMGALATFASLDETEDKRLAMLEVELARLKQSGPEALAARAEREAEAVAATLAHVEKLAFQLGRDVEKRFLSALAAVETADAAVELARKTFASEPISTTGSPAWHALFEAARMFVEHDCRSSFPPAEGELCPLCQQLLGADASLRLSRFEAFVKSTVERDAVAARKQLADERRSLEAVCINETKALAGLGIIELESPKLHTMVSSFLSSCDERLKALLEGTHVELSPAPLAELAAFLASRRDAAAHHRGLVDRASQQAMVDEMRELRARKQLQLRMKDVVEWHAALEAIALLERIRSSLDTTRISAKQRGLARLAVSDDLRHRLRFELDKLGFADMRIDLTCRGSRGRTKLRAALDGSRETPERVLSRGERQALALAFFLSEVACSAGEGPIVLDDPTDELDPEHRRHFARRLVEESARRQVVVITHDLALVYELELWAKAARVACSHQSLRRVAGRPGITRADLPWIAMSAKKRRKDLNARMQALAKLEREADERYEDDAQLVAELLRELWERAVEELLGGVISRLEPTVHTQQLGQVTVTDDLIRRIDEGMAETSTWVHDQPRSGHPAVPSVHELRAALVHFDEFFDLVTHRAAA